MVITFLYRKNTALTHRQTGSKGVFVLNEGCIFGGKKKELLSI